MGLAKTYKETSVYVHDMITHTCDAAKVILPIVFKQVQVRSVIDIGCGIGTWLKIATEFGVKDIVGVDGEYVDRDMLLIEESDFIPHDLTTKLDLNKRYDLGICLEVAEHLPENAADILVETITTHADVILFSAAIPGQGGQNHINEQWPAYWSEKFRQKGYVMKDFIRPQIWMNKQVDRWYRQNLFLVVKGDHQLSLVETPEILPLVHPDVFIAIHAEHALKIKQLRSTIELLKSRHIPSLVKRIFKRS